MARLHIGNGERNNFLTQSDGVITHTGMINLGKAVRVFFLAAMLLTKNSFVMRMCSNYIAKES
jgi:hypothetical protein